MPNSCVAPGCRSGYPGDSYKGRLFDFPLEETDPLRRKSWIQAMPRDGFEAKKTFKIMSASF